jgi:hypothetical protein
MVIEALIVSVVGASLVFVQPRLQLARRRVCSSDWFQFVVTTWLVLGIPETRLDVGALRPRLNWEFEPLEQARLRLVDQGIAW